MKPYKTWDHPNGGKIEWYEVAGRHFSLLDSDYEYADDYELHEWPGERLSIESGSPVPGSERRFDTKDAALAYLEQFVVN